tara:strand:+ start:2182 stop:2364 length:183 start_codon:yes stop_codon:yes gene_type:complete
MKFLKDLWDLLLEMAGNIQTEKNNIEVEKHILAAKEEAEQEFEDLTTMAEIDEQLEYRDD